MAVMTKGSRGTAVKQSTLVDAHSALQSLPEKQKEELSLKQAVAKLKVPLQAALAKGYSYPELAVILKDNGIVISAATLKNYVPVGKRSGKRLSKGTKSQADLAGLDQADPSEAEDASAQSSAKAKGKTSQSAETTSTKPRGGRGKAKATEEAESSSDGSSSSTAKPAAQRRSTAAKTRTSTKQSTTGKAKPTTGTRTKSSRTRK
ncbi:hypothetical protein [Pantanalinema sp. GBBB05]|uniref:hypothetical protein n=1 Tax=Pantanalinema sp. GBBB05 TaxID=2604139 RepID=UPI001DECD5D5|nr:hypothetical protein [Pantanalinema sp. GBBB05]